MYCIRIRLLIQMFLGFPGPYAGFVTVIIQFIYKNISPRSRFVCMSCCEPEHTHWGSRPSEARGGEDRWGPAGASVRGGAPRGPRRHLGRRKGTGGGPRGGGSSNPGRDSGPASQAPLSRMNPLRPQAVPAPHCGGREHHPWVCEHGGLRHWNVC